MVFYGKEGIFDPPESVKHFVLNFMNSLCRFPKTIKTKQQIPPFGHKGAAGTFPLKSLSSKPL